MTRTQVLQKVHTSPRSGRRHSFGLVWVMGEEGRTLVFLIGAVIAAGSLVLALPVPSAPARGNERVGRTRHAPVGRGRPLPHKQPIPCNRSTARGNFKAGERGRDPARKRGSGMGISRNPCRKIARLRSPP